MADIRDFFTLVQLAVQSGRTVPPFMKSLWQALDFLGWTAMGAQDWLDHHGNPINMQAFTKKSWMHVIRVAVRHK
eukprot:1755774-Amphidinium_carterae.1